MSTLKATAENLRDDAADLKREIGKMAETVTEFGKKKAAEAADAVENTADKARRMASRAMDDASDAAEETASKARRFASRAAETAGEYAETAREKAGEYAEYAKERALVAKRKAADMTGDVSVQVASMVRERPMAALGVAAGLGLFIGMFMLRDRK